MIKKREKLEFLWLYRAAWLEEVMAYAFVVGLFVISALVGVELSGCSIVHYEGKPDGTTIASGYVLGTDTAFDGAVFTSEAPGGKRSISVNSATGNQTDGIKATNELMGTVVGAAVKAAVKP